MSILRTMAVILLFATILLQQCTSDSTGSKLPSFEATTLNGVEVNTETLLGKVVVINIWGTWCGMCRAEIPELNQLVASYTDDDEVVFLAITDESSDKVARFLQQQEFNFLHITDRPDLKDLLQTGMVQYVPQNLVVDPQGNIRFDVSEYEGDVTIALTTAIEAAKEGQVTL